MEGAYGGYLQDVQRVWEQCKLLDQQAITKSDQAPYLGEQIRCAVVEASLHSLASNIPADFFAPLVMNKIWTFAQVLVYIRQITKASQRSDAISWIAPYLTNEQLGEIFLVAKDIDDENSRAGAFCALVVHTPNIDLDKIFLSVQEFETKDGRANVLIELAKYMPENRLSEVLDAARNLTGEWRQPLVLSNLAKRLPGLWNDMIHSTKTIVREEDRCYVLKILAKDMPKNYLCDLLVAVESIEKENNRFQILLNLALKMPREKLSKVYAAANKIKDENNRAKIFEALANRVSDSVLKNIISEARNIKDENIRARLLSALAERAPKLLDEAFKSAQKITDEYEKALVFIILSVDGLDLWSDAIILTKTIKDEARRAYIFGLLAKNVPESRLNELLEPIRDIQDEGSQARAMFELAQCKSELWDEVLAITGKIEDEYKRADILYTVSTHVPNIYLNKVLILAKQIKYGKHRAHALRNLAERISGLWGEILTSLNDIGDISAQSHIFSNLVEYLSDNELEEMISIAHDIPYDISRTQLLSVMVNRIPELTPEALSIAKKIEPEGDRAKILEILAENMQSDELNQILDVVREMVYRRGIANVLLILCERMPVSQLFVVLDVARQIDDENIQGEVLCSLTKHIPNIWNEAFVITIRGVNEESKSKVLAELVKHAPENKLSEILATVKELQDLNNKSRVLVSLAERRPELWDTVFNTMMAITEERSRFRALLDLPPNIPDFMIDKVLMAAKQLKDEWDRAALLKALAEYVPDIKLKQIISMEKDIKDPSSRAFLLFALANRLPSFWDDALSAVRAIRDKDKKAFILMISGKYTLELLSEAFDAAIVNEQNRTTMLSVLVNDTKTKLSNKRQYALIDQCLPALAGNTRPEFLSNTVTLMSFIINIGTEDTPREIYAAVRDVTTWWP